MQQNDCKFDDSKVAATDSGCVDVESGSESSLKKSVAEVGPVSVAIDASHSSFQSYAGGKNICPLVKKVTILMRNCILMTKEIIKEKIMASFR